LRVRKYKISEQKNSQVRTIALDVERDYNRPDREEPSTGLRFRRGAVAIGMSRATPKREILPESRPVKERGKYLTVIEGRAITAASAGVHRKVGRPGWCCHPKRRWLKQS